MTWQRVKSRNHLGGDGYLGNTLPEPECFTNAGASIKEQVDPELKHVYDGWREAVQRFNGQVNMLMGDLHRLERDTLDERAICNRIASRVGIDEDIVAAVLKEYLSW